MSVNEFEKLAPRWDLTVSIVSYYSRADVEVFLEGFFLNNKSSLKRHVFIINNGNDCVKDLEERYSDLSVYQMKENIGFGAGHNYVLDKIDSTYHAIVNPDVLYIQDALSDLIEYLHENRDVGMVAPLIKSEYGGLQKVYRRQITLFDLFVRYFLSKVCVKRFDKHTMRDIVECATEPFECEFIQGSFLLIRSSIFKQIGGFDERYFIYVEDADLCRRVSSISKVMVYPKVFVIHKWKKESHWNRKLFLLHAKSIIAYFQKWGWKIA